MVLKVLKWIGICFVGLIALGMILEATKSPEQKTAEALQRNEQAAAIPVAKPSAAAVLTSAERSAEESSPASSLTGPQKNAARSAAQYLRMSGFSRDGLIHQLSSDAGEGYDVSDAVAAVDSLNVDWNEQATRSAKQYLSMQGFSCKGLVRQLSSRAGEKFTVNQATYGAQQAGACK